MLRAEVTPHAPLPQAVVHDHIVPGPEALAHDVGPDVLEPGVLPAELAYQLVARPVRVPRVRRLGVLLFIGPAAPRAAAVAERVIRRAGTP